MSSSVDDIPDSPVVVTSGSAADVRSFGPARSVVVVGMHRSGTSGVTELLARNGGDLGDPAQLMPATEFNPHGYFENNSLSAYNDAMLALVHGSTWWAPPGIEDVRRQAEGFVASARREWRVRRPAGTAGFPLVKDPRMSLLLPVWRPVIGQDALFVVCIRDSLAVARSLLARDQMELHVGLALWEAYNISLLAGLSGAKAVFVGVDELALSAESRATLVHQVREATGQPRLDEVDDPFDPDLIGSAVDADEQLQHLSGSQLRLARNLSKLPRAVIVVDDLRHLYIPSATLRTLDRNRAVADEAERRRAELAELTERREAELAELIELRERDRSEDDDRQEVDAGRVLLQAQLDAALGRVTELDNRLTDSNRARLEAEQGRDRAGEAAEAAEQRLQATAAELDGLRAELGELHRRYLAVRVDRDQAWSRLEAAALDRAARADLERAVDQARSDQVALRSRLTRASSDLVKAESALEVARAELSALRDQSGSLQAAHSESSEEAAAAAGALARMRDHLDRSEQRVAELTAELQRTHEMYGAAFSSRSWRWTRPLRRERAAAPGAPHVDPVVLPQNPAGTTTHGAPGVGGVPDQSPAPIPRTAVVLHIFYEELWEPLVAQLGNIQRDVDVFVSLVAGETEHLRDRVLQQFPDADVRTVENRGRDIAPFFAFVRSGALDDYDAVLKLHTKRSHHRVDGDAWRTSLWHGLLPDPRTADHLARLVASHPDVGCIVPAGNVLGEEFLGSNEERVTALLARIGIDFRPTDVRFPAGSMYWLDGDLVQLLKALAIDPVADFEDELGQIDGSTAHAFERLIGIIVARRGQTIVQAEDATSIDPVPDWARTRRPKVLAFYLPQFHPIPENDAWWGEGFTEWTNVDAATPWHAAQSLPREPAPELGRYRLTDVKIMEQQGQLARDHGLDGFLVYHYWFSGKRLLEAPMQQLLENPDIHFPYALVWANENWTRAWDGLDRDVLVEQRYVPGWEFDLVSSMAPHLKDRRYLRIDGQPLVVIFKPSLVPDLVAAVARLRQAAAASGVGPVHVAGVLHDRHVDTSTVSPTALDSWFEFPPLSGPSPRDVTGQFAGVDTRRGSIYSYPDLVDQQHFRPLIKGRRLHPGAMPSWDNTPRRSQEASSFAGSNPADFRRWLAHLRKSLAGTSSAGEMVVAINAWNEWAETAYLEPDRQTGRANLEAVRSAFGLPDSV
jgi:lipopolysaccharide biosynthesis protein